MSPKVPAPRRAATVLLLREEEDRQGFSVLMVQRSLTSAFMPGAYVFPGGQVDAEDSAAPVAELAPEEAARRFGGVLTPEEAFATLRAAAREAEEEAAVQITRLSALWTFARWITPPIEARRFDTWFLVGRIPEGARPRHDEGETIASRWVEPKSALAGYGDGDLLLAPPTYYTLWDLSRFETVESVLDDARGRRIVPIEPSFREVDGRMALILPGDPLHPAEFSVDGPTRVVMGDGGRWWVVDGR